MHNSIYFLQLAVQEHQWISQKDNSKKKEIPQHVLKHIQLVVKAEGVSTVFIIINIHSFYIALFSSLEQTH